MEWSKKNIEQRNKLIWGVKIIYNKRLNYIMKYDIVC